MKFIQDRYVSVVAFSSTKKDDGDVCAWLYRGENDGRWHIEYRFRYYVDDESHDSKDEKSFYHWRIVDGATEENARERLRTLVRLLVQGDYARAKDVDEVVLESDNPEA